MTEPTYPDAPPPQYPGAPPQHPTVPPQSPQGAPPYPGATPPPYPGTTPPEYPATAPQYPTATPPQYPTSPPPQYPTTAVSPQYPASAPPQYPAASPQYPAPTPPPQQPPRVPAQGFAPPPAPPQPPVLDRTVDIDPHTGRIHLAARQRGADATAIGQLVFQLPHFLCSLLVIGIISMFLAAPFDYLLIGAWIASGALVFHRPTEKLLARYLFRMRPALHSELTRLEPIWHQVTAKAGVSPETYDLWIEDHKAVNATAAAGHIVGVTRYALETLPDAQLAAVLAHELGHHRGGHAWATLLGYWYSMPARIAWAAFRIAAVIAFQIASVFSLLGALVVGLVSVVVVVAVALSFPPLLLVLVTPYLLAAVGRRSELRADIQAAELGFADAMIEVFHGFLRDEEQALAIAARENGGRAVRPGLGQRLLSSHPDTHTRIRRLEDWRAAAAAAAR
ncbi:M48 family metalloprotease [Kitasatospora aureofaciens]|uniref:M48 family metalloprotease n=1 Tax=Kitasatospora aureofaciens TaxID=1894 RepID=UPI0033B4864B